MSIELSGERIDIVRWSDDRQALIPNALQPAEVEEVILCQMLGRAIVLVREDQLSLAIGKRGQNVRLASKLCGWDIEIMTRDELDEQIERAVMGFSALEGVESELAEKLVGEGFLSYDDLSVIEPDALMEMGGLGEEQAALIVKQAEDKAEEAEKVAAEQRRERREKDHAAKNAAPIEAELSEEGEAGESRRVRLPWPWSLNRPWRRKSPWRRKRPCNSKTNHPALRPSSLPNRPKATASHLPSPKMFLPPITLATVIIVRALEYRVPTYEVRFAHPYIRSGQRAPDRQ